MNPAQLSSRFNAAEQNKHTHSIIVLSIVAQTVRASAMRLSTHRGDQVTRLTVSPTGDSWAMLASRHSSLPDGGAPRLPMCICSIRLHKYALLGGVALNAADVIGLSQHVRHRSDSFAHYGALPRKISSTCGTMPIRVRTPANYTNTAVPACATRMLQIVENTRFGRSLCVALGLPSTHSYTNMDNTYYRYMHAHI